MYCTCAHTQEVLEENRYYTYRQYLTHDQLTCMYVHVHTMHLTNPLHLIKLTHYTPLPHLICITTLETPVHCVSYSHSLELLVFHTPQSRIPFHWSLCSSRPHPPVWIWLPAGWHRGPIQTQRCTLCPRISSGGRERERERERKVGEGTHEHVHVHFLWSVLTA